MRKKPQVSKPLDRSESATHYSLREVAQRWRCSRSHVLALVRKGMLKAIDISTNPPGRSHFIIRVDDLDAFETDRTTKPPTPVQQRRPRAVRRDQKDEYLRAVRRECI